MANVKMNALWKRAETRRTLNELKNRINELKKEKDAVILAHYYVNDEIQEVADYIGDSFYLSQVATRVDAQTIVENYEYLAVVCYINSTAELKMYSDVCVTSSNAVKIVKALPNQNIFFIPDGNLGRYVAEQVPEKNIILNDGYCPVHARMSAEAVRKAKAEHPKAPVLAHPECTGEVLTLADYIGSTSGIIEYAEKNPEKEYIVCTETGVFYELVKKCPDKSFYPVMEDQICPDMKMITLEKIVEVLENEINDVELEAGWRERANAPLINMLELGK